MRTITERPQNEFLPRVGAGCLVLLGVFMVLTAVMALAVPPLESLAGVVVMTTVGVGFGAAGVYWWRFVSGADERRRREFEEKLVLGVAAAHRGVATIAQIALETDMSTDEAREAVERLCARGVAYPEVLDDGAIEYRFGGLLGR